MATLNSPGVSVTVIDESQYVPSGAGSVPLIITATRQNKLNEQGELAAGTLPEMGDRLSLVTSRKDLLRLLMAQLFMVTKPMNMVYMQHGMY